MPKDPIKFHKKLKGKIEVISRTPVETREDLSVAYTPGVAGPCEEIAKDISKVYDYTRKGNLVAVITDGSAVLGLGDIGPEASLPVMEGKCILMKEFAGVDAFPIALKTQDVDEIVRTVELISPMFGGINLEDICAPRCFEIEKRLSRRLDTPVFHDDQHGTAVVVLAGLYNALKIVNKKIDQIKIVINGAGAAGIAVANILLQAGVKDIIMLDSKGTIFTGRKNLNDAKKEIAKKTNRQKLDADLKTAMQGSDVFLGVSKPNLVTRQMVKSMAEKPIIFAMANPVPEIMPDEAKAGGAAVMATGRSDFPNQINNVLAFPGIFKGLLEGRITKVTMDMKIAAAKALADYVKKPKPDMIIPLATDKSVANVVAKAVQKSS